MRQVPLERDINIINIFEYSIIFEHCHKWMFWVCNLHPERAIYSNVDITL